MRLAVTVTAEDPTDRVFSSVLLSNEEELVPHQNAYAAEFPLGLTEPLRVTEVVPTPEASNVVAMGLPANTLSDNIKDTSNVNTTRNLLCFRIDSANTPIENCRIDSFKSVIIKRFYCLGLFFNCHHVLTTSVK